MFQLVFILISIQIIKKIDKIHMIHKLILYAFESIENFIKKKKPKFHIRINTLKKIINLKIL